MTRFVAVLAVTLGLVGTASASQITCSGTSTAVSNCMAANSLFWTDRVDWEEAFGSAQNPNMHPTGTPWNTGTHNGGGLIVSLQSPDTLGRFDNVSRIDTGGGNWQFIETVFPNFQEFSGHFDAPPNPNTGIPGDHLIGDFSSGQPLTIIFSQNVFGAALRLSTTFLSTFTGSISAYSSAVPTPGTLLDTVTLVGVNGGGNCISLGNNPPVPCNDAPFLGFQNNTAQIRSLVISTNDNQGLWIDTLFIQGAPGPVPEPAMPILIGSGLAALAWFSRRRAAKRR